MRNDNQAVTTPAGEIWIDCIRRHLQLARDGNDDGRNKILELIELLERFYPDECGAEEAKWIRP